METPINTYDFKTARKQMGRTMKSLDRIIQKKLSRYSDVTFVLGVNYLSECNRTIGSTWRFAGNDALTRKLQEWTPALENTLSLAEMADGDLSDDTKIDWLTMPASAEKRAEKTRKGLRLLWLDHVRGTPYENKKQMFDLVKKGVCRKFEWWDRVTDNAPFESKTIDDPKVSLKLYKHVATTLHCGTS